MKFVPIPAGRFLMGSLDAEPDLFEDEELQHDVIITKPFHLGIHPVTQAQYEAVMGNNPSHFGGAYMPVETVSWEDAVRFCARLSKKEGKEYRLPTEAEWEYACRAGTTTATALGDALSSAQANVIGENPYGVAAKGPSLGKTMPVGSYPPNAWGLYDMYGNVWEWCADWYGEYPAGAVTDPTGPMSGTGRVLRGGSWIGGGHDCRSACRFRNAPGSRYPDLGFRVVSVSGCGLERCSDA
jgi:formylglycine-generating enzyme required for sulfatase activity